MDTTELFLQHANELDQLTMMVRCHQDFDSILTDLINELLIESHYLDVQRIPFSLKVELAIAAGLLTKDIRSPLLKFNTIRNEFAHQIDRQISNKDARDFYNVFDAQPISSLLVNMPFESFETPWYCVRMLVSVLFVSLDGTLNRIREGKLWERAVVEKMIEVTAKLHYSPPDLDGVNADIKARFERLKRASDKA